MQQYNVVVIGAGPGGYVAAIRAAQLGAHVAVVEKDKLGGTCLNRGCIPIKALLSCTDKINDLKKSADFGIKVNDYQFDLGHMVDRKNKIVKKLIGGIEYLFNKNNVDLIKGEGRIQSRNLIEVKINNSRKQLQTENIILATGSTPMMLPSFNYDGENIITSKEALNLQKVPESLLIVGGGVIGCEFASVFSSLGSKITVVDVMPRILPTEDKEISKQMQKLFEKQGIDINTEIKINRIETDEEGIVAYIDNGTSIKAERALISIGRQLTLNNTGLEDIGVNLDENGAVIVNKKLETNISGIYAVGDITDKVMLAHVASTQGKIAAENIMGADKTMDYDSIPNCIFTDPEIASVGLSKEEAEADGHKISRGQFFYQASGKALAMGEKEGKVTIIADQDTDKILGGHIIGAHASDLISEITLAIKNNLTSQQVAETIHAHPTLAENVMEAAESVSELSIHS